MEGVTILSVATVSVGVPIWGLIFIGLLVGGFGYCLFYSEDDKALPIIAAISAFLIILFVPIMSDAAPQREVTEYKVTIDDSVSYVEFIEKYEVINQEGEIYTVRERTE